MRLNDEKVARYARQLIVPGFGEDAQARLLDTRVRVVGCDAVASAALVALVQAGVGRIWLDDPETVSPADTAGWLFPPSSVGTPRVQAARGAVAPLSAFVTVEPYPVGGIPGATLVSAPSAAQALAAAEGARRAGIPHVVVDADADGGAVVTVPPGEPCYACGRTASMAGRPPLPGAAALASLAALELVLLVAATEPVRGRRIELLRGVPTVRPTLRLAGCVCAGAQPAEG